jgi:hypothetical protein
MPDEKPRRKTTAMRRLVKTLSIDRMTVPRFVETFTDCSRGLLVSF